MSQCADDGSRDGEHWSDTDVRSVAEQDLYTPEQINYVLDETKGKTGVELSDFFSDPEKFIASVIMARKTSNYEGLSQKKRYRLNKHLTSIRQRKQTE